MATRFEIVLPGENPVALRSAGEEALDEIDRLETQLSLYRESSEITHLNARAAHEPVRVTPGLFALLRHAQALHRETRGAFDITIGPLVRCWGFMGSTGRMPRPEEVAEARARVGMHLVELREENFTVRFARPGVMLDLGAIGKGYAIERAVEVLREAGVTDALVHGGTSTVYGLGHPPDADAWMVAVDRPPEAKGVRTATASNPSDQAPGQARVAWDDAPVSEPRFLAKVPLRDEALSMSAVWGRCFEADGKVLGHVLDPRTGQPASSALLAVVCLPSATETDALSTALLTLGPDGFDWMSQLRPNMRTLLASASESGLRVQAHRVIEQAQSPTPKAFGVRSKAGGP